MNRGQRSLRGRRRCDGPPADLRWRGERWLARAGIPVGPGAMEVDRRDEHRDVGRARARHCLCDRTGGLMMSGLDRRSFLRYSAVLGVGTSAASILAAANSSAALGTATLAVDDSFPWAEATHRRHAGRDGARARQPPLSITRDHLARIERMDWAGPRVELDHRGQPRRRGDRTRARSRARGRAASVDRCTASQSC